MRSSHLATSKPPLEILESINALSSPESCVKPRLAEEDARWKKAVRGVVRASMSRYITGLEAERVMREMVNGEMDKSEKGEMAVVETSL